MKCLCGQKLSFFNSLSDADLRCSIFLVICYFEISTLPITCVKKTWKASITLKSPNISRSQDIFFITLETCLFFSCVFGIKSLPEVVCGATDAWRYDSFQIWELPEKLYSRTFMLDVHCNRIIALHQTHILVFQFGHYVWRRLCEGDIFVYLFKRECHKWKCLRKQCNGLLMTWEIVNLEKFKRFLYRADLCV